MMSMRAGTFVGAPAAVLALAAWGVVACSFGPDAYSGPNPLTPEEAGLAPDGGDDSSGNAVSSSDSALSEGPLGDQGLPDTSPDAPPD
jgi:hypothetical protein